MRIYYCTVIFLMVSASSSATSPDSVRRYYEEKNKAEVYIMNTTQATMFYTEALDAYKKAFGYKTPNRLDIYNALIVAYLLEDSITAKSYFNQMAFHGLNKERLEEYEGSFGYYAKSHGDFYKWLSSDYDSLYKVALNSSISKYAHVMDSLLQADQSVRKSNHLNDEEVQRLLYIDSTNLSFLKNYIKEYGFPSYDRVGLFESCYDGNIQGVGPLWFMLWHTRHTSKMLNETLLEAARRGEFDPDEYALIIDLQAPESIYYNALPREIGKDGKMNFLPVPNEKMINEKRASIYLDPVDVLKRKLIFQEYGDVWFRFKPYWMSNANFAPINLRTWKVMKK